MSLLFPHEKQREQQAELIKEITNTLETKQNLIIHAPTGSGKCVGKDTLILTENGLENIENVYLKNRKVNSLGKSAKIYLENGMIIKKKKSILYEVRTSTGRTIKTTYDHKFLVINNTLFWEKLKNLKIGDYIACSRKLKIKEQPIKLIIKDLFKIKTINTDILKIKLKKPLKKYILNNKKQNNLSYLDLSKKLGYKDKCSILKRINTNIFHFKDIKILANLFNLKIDNLEIKALGYKGSKLIDLDCLDEDFAYFFGLLMGDGCISGKRKVICISNSDKIIIKKSRALAKKFGSKLRQVHGHKYDYIFDNKSLVALLYILGFPEGDKYINLEIPSFFFKNKNLLSLLISGLYDTDGSVYRNVIEFTTKSKKLNDSLMHALLVFGIYPIIKQKFVKNKKYYRILITNKENNLTFYNKIGFKLKRKQKLIKNISIEFKSNKNIDIIPNIYKLIKNCRLKLKIPYSRKTEFRTYESYIYNFRKPTREGLIKLICYFKKENKNKKKPVELELLWQLAKSDIFWDKIVNIKKLKRDYVFDATIPSTNNFIGNGIILHNTAASLAPALTYVMHKPLTIFFLTSKHTQHKIAIETLQKIKEKFNLDFGVVDLVGKKHMCLQSGIDDLRSSEFADYCHDQTEKGLCDYYENSKVKFNIKLISEKIKNILHMEELKELCKNDKLCPFEISCALAKKSKVIVCDYNHILNKSIRENLFAKIDKDLNNSIIIIDESHNLPERIRDNLTSQISSYTLKQSLREVGENLSSYMTHLLSILEGFAQKIPIQEKEGLIKREDFIKEVEKEISYDDLIDTLNKVSEIIMEEKKKCFTKGIANFLEAWKGPNESFARVLTKGFDNKGKLIINLTYRCLDPSIILKPLSENCHSLILMSGTLAPTEMYRDLFNIKAKCLEYKNPFPIDNKLSIIVPGVSTKFTLRNDAMYSKIAGYCSDVVNNIPGNSIIFFPSYQLRDDINNFLKIDKTILLEQKDFTKKEKFETLDKFETYKKSGCVLLAVSSGNFGESVDLLGDLLKCVVVVGLPLPQPNLEIKELIKYYDLKFNKGWDYGYILPAIIKSFQNAGRCIRSDEDRGVVVFLDERYSWPNYYKVFPKGENIKISKEPVKYIKEFFG